MRDSSFFYDEIVRLRNAGTPEYGGNIMPVLRLFCSIQKFEEKREFQAALARISHHPASARPPDLS
jgi:hypothetical protein